VARIKLIWQSKLVLLLVLPFAGAGVVLQAHWWAVNSWPVTAWTAGLSLLLGLAVLQLRAATHGGAFVGTVITASLMFSTATFTPGGTLPYARGHTALLPVLAVFLLTWGATRLGRETKECLGTAERKQGRTAAQVAANLGMAALLSDGLAQSLAGRQPLVLPCCAQRSYLRPASRHWLKPRRIRSPRDRPGDRRAASHDHHPARVEPGRMAPSASPARWPEWRLR